MGSPILVQIFGEFVTSMDKVSTLLKYMPTVGNAVIWASIVGNDQEWSRKWPWIIETLKF